MAYGLLDTITDQFRPAIESVEGKIEQIESSLSNMDHGNPMQLLKTIGANRGIATRLRRLVGEKSEVLQALRKRLEDRRAASSMILAPREIDLHLSDVHDHLHAATQELTHLEVSDLINAVVLWPTPFRADNHVFLRCRTSSQVLRATV